MSLQSSQIYRAKAHLTWQSVARLFVFFWVTVVIFGSAPAAASAIDVYVSQNGTGTGTSCADARSASWFNTLANWGAGSTQIGPGTTVHLCGTFTGTAGQTMLTFHGSGTIGNPINLLFENGTNLTAPYWSANGAINTNGNTWLVINGDITNGRQGIIQNTANGTGLANQQTSRGIFADNCANCKVKNLTIANLYVHTSTADSVVSGSTVNCVRNVGGNDFTIDNILCYDASWGIYANSSNFTVSNSEIYNIDHGVVNALTGSGIVTNFNIYGNHIHDYVNWDTTSNMYHHDGIHVWANSGAQVTGGNIYNNVFDGDVGANVTAHVYIETVTGSPAGTHTSNIKVFNNVFLPSGGSRNYRAIWLDGGAGNPSNNALYNNFINIGSNGFEAVRVNGQTAVIVENNIIMASASNRTDIVLTGSTVGTVDYNTYLSNSGGNTFVWQSSFTGSLATWRTLCSCDAHSQLVTSAQINATSDGHLLTGSVAVDAGTNLTLLNITALNFDKAGSPRPASGAWTAGAYNAGTQPSRPNPPTNLRVTVQ